MKKCYIIISVIAIGFAVSGCHTMKNKEKNGESNEQGAAQMKPQPDTATVGGIVKIIKNMIIGTGEIKYIDLEGGFYGIIGDDGKKYSPINLKEEFRIDGLRVSFEAKKRNDVVTIRMWGTNIEIVTIEKLK